jgi:Gluconate 2-dehydrogenase subunit 3
MNKPTNEEGLSRRDLLTQLGTGLTFITVQSVWGPVSPALARAKDAALRNLSAAEGRTLESFGEVLVPGAREAGIAHYVDDQLSRQDSLLFLKYMDYDGSYVEFYKQGLRSLERKSAARYGRALDAIALNQKVELVRELSRRSPADWKGPPAPLFYFVVRNDAVDVYYGTQTGFERLGIPYMVMIKPHAEW